MGKLSEKLQLTIFDDNNYRSVLRDEKISLEELKTRDKNDWSGISYHGDDAYKIVPVDRLEDVGISECGKVTKKKKETEGRSLLYLIVAWSHNRNDIGGKNRTEKKTERGIKTVKPL